MPGLQMSTYSAENAASLMRRVVYIRSFIWSNHVHRIARASEVIAESLGDVGAVT